tara:strand:- start:15 stop:641 length:627 start_codon:yes stop_codon:yes gene_type:complete
MEDCCPICLENYSNNPKKKEDIKKTLSCGHTLHYKCFRGLIFRGKNFFIECPLCRVINGNIDKPYSNPEDNLRVLCSHKVGNVRCLCKTKENRVCKRKSTLFNYGMCYQHHTNVLPKEKYELMVDFLYLILLQRNDWFLKIHLFDIGKKLIIHKDIKKLEDIMYYFYKYINIKKLGGITDYYDLYDHYDLKRPPLSWVNYCYKKVVII